MNDLSESQVLTTNMRNMIFQSINICKKKKKLIDD